MEEQGPEELTRPPDDRDLLALARELNRLGARYVVVGGVAINRLGFVRATEDIDLLIARDRENQGRVKRALEILPDKAVCELGDEDLGDWLVVRVNDEITVDLMTEACGVSFAEAESEIEWVQIRDVTVPFATPKLMLKTKQGAREKDMIDRRFLEELLQKRSGNQQ